MEKEIKTEIDKNEKKEWSEPVFIVTSIDETQGGPVSGVSDNATFHS